jgi:putative membrane protein
MKGMAFRFCGCVVAMPLCAWLLPGVHATDPTSAWMMGIVLGLLYLLLRPIAKLILTPFNCLTFGLLGFVVDALLVQLAARQMDSFSIDSFWWALAASLVVTLLRESLGKLAEGHNS